MADRSSWERVRLGDLGSAFSTGPFGSAVSAKNFRAEGVPMIRGSNLTDDVGHRLVEDDLVFVGEELADRYPRSGVKHGDLVFTCWGTVGQVGLIDERAKHERYIVSNKQMRMTPDANKADALFLYYYLAQPSVVNLIQSEAIGSSVPGFNLGQLRSLPVWVPGLQEQRAIAEVLGALDEKIAVNDTVIARVDELLAARFEAHVREGAERAVLGDVAAVNMETLRQGEGWLRYIDISSVGQGMYHFPELTAWSNAPSRARRKVREGDTLWSTVRPNRRSHALNLSSDARLIASTGLAVLTPLSVGASYLYEATRRQEFSSFLESVAEGSAYPAVRAERFLEAPVPIFHKRAQREFESVASTLRRRAHAAAAESRSLTATRDALLPALMSGKLRVKNAERVTESLR